MAAAFRRKNGNGFLYDSQDINVSERLRISFPHLSCVSLPIVTHRPSSSFFLQLSSLALARESATGTSAENGRQEMKKELSSPAWRTALRRLGFSFR